MLVLVAWGCFHAIINIVELVLAEIDGVVWVGVGYYHVCVQVEGGEVKCIGDNASGEIGVGVLTGSFGTSAATLGLNLPFVNLGASLSVVQVAVGVAYTCSLLNNHLIKCWGENNLGQLGQGRSVASVGTGAFDMGDNLPYTSLGDYAFNITCGGGHSCAILSTAQVKCWGNNQYGQLGIGSAVSKGTLSTDMGAALPTVNLGLSVTVEMIRVGGQHTCALLSSAPPSNLKCWGLNSDGVSTPLGQLGIGSTALWVGTQPSDMGDNLPVLNLGTNITVLDFALGNDHTCAIVTGFLIKCWGNNNSNQLGLIGISTIGTTGDNMGTNLTAVDIGTDVLAIRVALGYQYTCVLTNSFQIKCWGLNSDGQLGLGSTSFIFPSIAGELGPGLPYVQLGTESLVEHICWPNRLDHLRFVE